MINDIDKGGGYRECLVIELTLAGVSVSVEHHVHVEYRGRRVRDDLRVDLLVDGRLIVEVKAVDRLHPVHQAQVITYLKLTGCPAGLLLNFNASSMRAGLKRLDHPVIYAEKVAARQKGRLGTPKKDQTGGPGDQEKSLLKKKKDSS